jgi:hypothetical protein
MQDRVQVLRKFRAVSLAHDQDMLETTILEKGSHFLAYQPSTMPVNMLIEHV